MFWKKSKWFKRNRTYIIPSKQGLRFIFLLIVLLTMGLIYGNNLTMGLCFLLTGWFIIIMLLSHENIRTLELVHCRLLRAYSGEHAELEIELTSQKWFDNRYDLEIYGQGFKQEVSLPSGQTRRFVLRTMNLSLPRGQHSDVRIRLKSEFPFGLFRPWKTFDLKETWLVAPSRKLSAADLKNKSPEDDREFSSFEMGQYKKPGQIVDWKMTTIRSEQDPRLIVFRDFQPRWGQLAVFDWNELTEETEERLSRLTALVADAYTSGIPYQLILPHWRSQPNATLDNFERCLYELALFPKS
ncbi:MAG: hypothetical protein V4736_04435 [Bdellovibrionota bacterium]